MVIGSGLATITFIIYGLQLLLLPTQIISYLSRPIDKSRLRFLLLSLSFIAFNTVWIFPRLFWSTDSAYYEILLVNTGIFLASYVYHYFTAELGVLKGKYKARTLLILLILVESIRQFSKFNISEQYEFQSAIICTIFFESVALVFVVRIVRNLLRSNTSKNSPLFFAMMVTLGIAIALPALLFFDEVIYLPFMLANLALLFTSFAYLRQFLAQTRLENKIFQDGKSYSLLSLSDQDLITPDLLLDFELTTREGEIAMMILEGSSYSDIASGLYLAYSTISKYASTIFKKVGVNDLSEFRRKFHSYSKLI